MPGAALQSSAKPSLKQVHILTALSTFFFTYFAFIGAVNPYFALWLQDSGYSAGQIGLMLAVPPALRLVGPTSWGRLADATGKRVKWLRLMAHVSAIGLLVVGLAPYGGEWRVHLALLGLGIMHAMLSGQVPLTEALLLQKLGANTHLYGRVRLYGSLGFIVAVMALGPLLDWLGTAWLLPLGAIMLLGHMANSWRLQDAPPIASARQAPQSLWQLCRLPHVPLFLSASFLMVFGHMALYIYFSLYLESAGYSKTVIGFLWVMSTVGEVAYFWWQARASTQPLRGYTRSYWAAVLRFGAMAWVAIPLGSPLWLLIVLQLLHTFTFATHHAASMVLVKRLFPASAGSTANALFNTVTYGLAGTLGALVCAALWTAFGDEGARNAQAVFTMSALACALGGLLALRLRRLLALAD
jgi:PPP family 3-phenylpropionic acid transporter